MIEGYAVMKMFRPAFAILLVALAPSWLAGGVGGGGDGERSCGTACLCINEGTEEEPDFECRVNGYEDGEYITDFKAGTCEDALDECVAWADLEN